MENHLLNHKELYRMPWTLPDNAISWLEPTAQCNLACDGCYRDNEKNSHKSFEEVKYELDIFEKLRNSDCISIAGWIVSRGEGIKVVGPAELKNEVIYLVNGVLKNY